MKLKLLKISAFVAGALPLLIGTDAVAFPGPPPGGGPPRMPAGGPPRLPGGGGPPMGLSGPPRGGPPMRPSGPPRAGGFNRPAVPGGGFRGGAGGPGPHSPSHVPNIARPGHGRPGGLAPNSTLAGRGPAHGGPGPQFPSKVQPLPKGGGSVLPSFASGAALGSIAQGKLPGAGPEGKGFPDLAGKGPGELLNSAQTPPATQQFWKNWGEQNQGRLADFQANRANAWNSISEFRSDQNVAGSFNQPQWNDYKNIVQNYRDNRAIEVTNNIQNNFDNNFNANWWGEHARDYAGKYAGYADKYLSYADKYASYADRYYSDDAGRYYGRYAEKYWWWTAATYTTAATFLALDRAYDRSDNYDTSSDRSGSYDTSYNRSASYGKSYYRSGNYDYGMNVVYQGDQVYADGRRVASAKEYSQQAIALANTPTEQPPPPLPPEPGQQAEYLPLGVWAMVQEEKGDAYMFFQISIDKDGVVTGAFKNLLSGEASPISGQVDKQTQRVAWKIGSNSSTVIETGLQNLTQDVASCLVHFGTDTTQTWLLVRLKDPARTDAP